MGCFACGSVFKKKKNRDSTIPKTDTEERKQFPTEQADVPRAEGVTVVQVPLTTDIPAPTRSTPAVPVSGSEAEYKGPSRRHENEKSASSSLTEDTGRSGGLAGETRVDKSKLEELRLAEEQKDYGGGTAYTPRDVKSAEEYKEIGKTTVQQAAGLVTDTAEIGVGLAADVTTQAASTATNAARTTNVAIHDSLVAPVADTVVDTASSALKTTRNVVAPIADTVVGAVSAITDSLPLPTFSRAAVDNTRDSRVSTRDVTSTTAQTVAEIPKTIVGGMALAAGGAAGVVATAAQTVAEIPKTLAGGAALAAGGAAGAVEYGVETVAGGAAYAAGGATGAASRVSASAQSLTAHIADPLVDTAQAAGYRANVTVHDVVAKFADTVVSGIETATKTISPGKKGVDEAVAAAEVALQKDSSIHQEKEGAVYKKETTKIETTGGRGQNPIFGVFGRKAK